MADRNADRLVVLHVLRLVGLAEVHEVAARTGLGDQRCGAVLVTAQSEGLVVCRQGRVSGWMLAAAGRAVVGRLVAEQLDASGARSAIEGAYRRFSAVNGGFLALCTDWQMIDDSTLNDHADRTYDASVIARLAAFDDEVQPVCRDLAHALDRFGDYGRRLGSARLRVERGDTDWFTSPRIDSFHTAWFELHEDLLVTLGIERARAAS